MKKIILEIELQMPSDFDLAYEQSELMQLESDIKAKLEEITGYSVLNILAYMQTL